MKKPDKELQDKLVKSYNMLRPIQLWVLFFWFIIGHKRAYKYVECIKNGMHGKAAFNEAERL